MDQRILQTEERAKDDLNLYTLHLFIGTLLLDMVHTVPKFHTPTFSTKWYMHTEKTQIRLLHCNIMPCYLSICHDDAVYVKTFQRLSYK